MNTSDQQENSALIRKSPAPITIAPTPTPASDVNENTATKSPRLLSPANPSQVDTGLPIIVTSMPFSPVSSQGNIVNFPSGINLTISNGLINVKNASGGESTLLVAPVTSSLSSTSASTITKPISVVTGTIPVMSNPATSVAVTTNPSSATMLGGGNQMLGTQIKMTNNPNAIQIRPQQVYIPPGTSIQSNNIAMAMFNRLSLPFQATPTAPAAVSISGPRGLTPGSSAGGASILSQQVQFQAVQPMRGTAVTLAAVTQAQMGQAPTMANQQMATVRPIFLNRPMTIAGRPQLITGQPTRLAPRLGTQVALQVGGQQSMGGATIMPIYRPTLQGKTITVATTPIVSSVALPSQHQANHQQQLLNQVVASVPGMTHISFRPSLPVASRLTPGPKIQGIPVSRFLRPPGQGMPITITSLSSPMSCDQPVAVVTTQGVTLVTAAAITTTNTTTNSKPGTATTSPANQTAGEKKKIDHFLGEKKIDHFLGDPPPRVSIATPLPSASSTESISASTAATVELAPVAKSPARDGGKGGEAKKEQAAGDAAFDALKAMDWSSEGIATLPGSNLKLKLNEFGMVEMVPEDLPALPVKTVMDSGVGVNTTDFSLSASLTSSKDASEGVSTVPTPTLTTTPTPTPVKEPVKQCEACGKYGFLKDFCKTGRFCSQACVGAFAGRKNKHSLLHNKVNMFSLKKKHKKLFTENGTSPVSGSQNATPTPSPSTTDETSGDKERMTTTTAFPGRRMKNFDWQAYLEEQKAIAAPARLFKDAFPTQKNGFKPGMKVEGVDPKHQNLFCVLSVAEVQGYRMRLHFDGYSECYDFWCNADSPFIFPVGFCEKNNKQLQPPKHVPRQNFNWASYLRTTKSVAAPKSLFLNQPSAVTPSAFRVGMKLEAVDRKNTVLICVATVADVLGDKILVHFDGWDDVYDYWCDITSPYIHPVGWCQENIRALSPPCDWPEEEIDHFTWDDYLAQSKAQAVPARAFKPRSPVAFEVGMRVEAVDRRNPIQVRVASIKEVRDHQVMIHFDGWDDIFDYWVDDDSPEIKPPGWCSRTGNSSLQPPPLEGEVNEEGNCPTPCCNGVGHVKGAKYTGHHSMFGCPYALQNMNKESTLMDRLGSTRVEEGTAAPLVARIKNESGEVRRCPHPGCDSSGHITGKFTSHHRLSGCPLYEKNIQRMNAELQVKPPIKPGRGRKRKNFSVSDVDSRDGLLPPGLSKIKKERTDQTTFVDSVRQSVFTAPETPSPEGPAFWDYQAKLLPGVLEFKGEEVKNWDTEKVARFVGSLPGCQSFEKAFREQEVDGESFLMLRQADIVNVLSIRLGPAVKIYNSILLFKQTTES